jgi:hypothetical protein
MYNKFEKAINIAKRTGDRIIVFDATQASDPFVVMSLAEYEKIAIGKSEVRGLTEDELLDKINRDIAIWKSEYELNNWPLDRELPDEKDTPVKPISVNFLEHSIPEKREKKERKVSQWAIPKDIKEAAEEVIEEDRQYLEEIKF